MHGCCDKTSDTPLLYSPDDAQAIRALDTDVETRYGIVMYKIILVLMVC
jgi:hypothetical protein